ncbi:MAG TPA: formate dehydrogenase subunit beta [Acidimicrobiia bacterium]|nr:formate dehydrogenase subunit beta [Acidimicrobiia bacterium]
MSTELGLSIRRKSATPAGATGIRRDTTEIAKVVDIDLCIGCKACEVACKEWNDLPAEETFNFGSYQSHQDLTAATWDLMRFKEIELDDGDIAWLIRKDSCLHCDDPGCLAACPAPGAIVQYTNGIVDFNQEKCIGCQYCVAGCPFDIPRFDQKTKKVYKCTLCVDRVSAGLEPACVKACPTGSIKFGGKHEMLDYAAGKVEKLKGRGFENAMLYDPSGVGGLHMMYVVPRGDRLEDYGLPADPQVPGNFFSALGVLRKLGTISVWGGLLASAIFYLRTGRRRTPSEDDAVAEAERLGQESFGDGNGERSREGTLVGSSGGNGADGDGADGGSPNGGGNGEAPPWQTERQPQEEDR